MRCSARATRKRMVALDPRINPFRPEIAAKYLKGQVEAARFVEGVRHEVVEPIAALRRTPSHEARLDTQALHGRTRHRLRDDRRRLGLGPARNRRLCRLAVGECARQAGPSADPQGRGAAHARLSRAGHQADAGGGAADGRAARHRAAGRAFRRHRQWLASAGRASCRRSRRGNRISSPSPKNSSTRLICGAARPRSASTAPAWCKSRCKPPASPARATATCRNWRSANCRRSANCGAAIWCSGRAMSPSRATRDLAARQCASMAVAIEPAAEAIARIKAAGSDVTSVKRI